MSFVLLLIVAAAHPKHSKLTMFELERRSKLGDKYAIKSMEREKLLVDVVSLQSMSVALLQVVIFSLSELTFGWAVGIVVAIFLAMGYGATANIRLFRNWSNKIYGRLEKPILNLIQKHPHIFKILRSAPTGGHTYSLHIDSREELQHLVAESDDILTPDEKKLIVNSLSFNDQLVRKVMTPRAEIDTIKKTEFLGPLTLDDLHKTGHSKLPVISSDIDHIIGILHLEGLLALDVKRSTTAEKAMEPKVYYIHQNQTLQHALTEFLTTRHYLLIVTNENRETVGLITLTDIIEALLGREIIDEFDFHDNLRIVASRKKS